MHTAPQACLLYALRAVGISNMVLEHILLKIFFQIINGPEPYMVQEHMILDLKSRPKSKNSPI